MDREERKEQIGRTVIDLMQKGGGGSGNWGHAGRPGKRGGSAPQSVAMSLSSGPTAATRQRIEITQREYVQENLT